MVFDTMRSYYLLRLDHLSSRAYPSVAELDIEQCEFLCAVPQAERYSIDGQSTGTRRVQRKPRHDVLTLSTSGAGRPFQPDFRIATARWSPPSSPQSGSPLSPTDSPIECAHSFIPTPISPQMTPYQANQAAQALYNASCSGDISMIQSLLNRGTSIDSAVLVPGLFENFSPPKSGQLSVLAAAASRHQLKVVIIFVAKGANINPKTNHSASSPLHQACRHDDIDIAQYLLQHGADVNLSDCFHTTPLMYAIKYGSVDLVRLLLAHNPNLNALNFIGYAAIHWTIHPNRPAVTRLLLEAGADLHHLGPDDWTPLHCAAQMDSLDVAELLLNCGADPFRRDAYHRMPIDLARASEHADMCKLISAAMLGKKRFPIRGG